MLERETTDAPAVPVALVIGSVALLVGSACIGARVGFVRLSASTHATRRLAEVSLPPQPRLQIDEAGDLATLLASQRRLLEEPSDDAHASPRGRHISIERAMRVLSHE